MSRKNLTIIIAVILFQVINLFAYVQLRNFRGFTETEYTERLIEPDGKNKPFRWTANVRLPFAILNLSDWMMPFHYSGEVIKSGMVQYSVPLKLNISDINHGSQGFKFPVEFLGGTMLDLFLISKYSTDIPELASSENQQNLDKVFIENFLNLRKFIWEMVFWSRVALIGTIEIVAIVIFVTLFSTAYILKKRRITRKSKIMEAYQFKEELKILMTRLQPEFDRAWLIIQNAKLIGTLDKEFHRQIYEAISLVVKDYGGDSKVLDFYRNAQHISTSELNSKVAELTRRADEWVNKQNFQAEQEKARLARFKSAKLEYAKMAENFSNFTELKGSREYGKTYFEVMRTLNAIHSELSNKKVHEKRFDYVRKALVELEQGQKELKESTTPV